MKRFAVIPPPRGWQTHGLQAGRAWLRMNRNAERPRDLWSPYRPYLATGFGHLCAYTVLYTPGGTVDHYIPWEVVRGTRQAHLAYQWSNFRYAAGWFNSSRKQTEIPDPYLVQDNWFELRLPSLELEATVHIPASERVKVANVMQWLRDDPRVIDQRQEWFRMYRDGELSFEGLQKKAPLIAAALKRQSSFLLVPDQGRLLRGEL